jgi:hypothetical protein
MKTVKWEQAEIVFTGGQKFTSGRIVKWTEFVKCLTCGEKFVGRGRTEKTAHADAVHWSDLHDCPGEGYA